MSGGIVSWKQDSSRRCVISTRLSILWEAIFRQLGGSSRIEKDKESLRESQEGREGLGVSNMMKEFLPYFLIRPKIIWRLLVLGYFNFLLFENLFMNKWNLMYIDILNL